MRAVNKPEDHEARDNMALASTLAGIAFSNCGVALVHALEYPLGGALHCSHGAGNGLLLPFVMRFNLPERKEKFAKIAELLGAEAGSDTNTMAERAIASAAGLGAPSTGQASTPKGDLLLIYMRQIWRTIGDENEYWVLVAPLVDGSRQHRV